LTEAGAAATLVFRNWLGYLRGDTSAAVPRATLQK
jgi:hypothetical protein